jgi:hypothetical protein
MGVTLPAIGGAVGERMPKRAKLRRRPSLAALLLANCGRTYLPSQFRCPRDRWAAWFRSNTGCALTQQGVIWRTRSQGETTGWKQGGAK